MVLTVLCSHSLAGAASGSGSMGLAYIGPGAGLGAIGALLAVLGAIVLCVAGLVLYPLHLLRNRLRGRHDEAVEGPSEARPST